MKIYKPISLLICFLSFGIAVFSQGSWEYRFVRDINPQYPSSDVWKAFSATAKPLSVAVPFGLLAVALIEKNKPLELSAVESFGSLVVAVGTTELLKRTVQRARPYQVHPDIYVNKIEEGYSFPSGHTAVAFSTAVSVSLDAKKWYITAPALAWAASVGYSRMYLGEHYPSDVIMGALVGSGSAYLSHWLTRKLLRKKNVSAAAR